MTGAGQTRLDWLQRRQESVGASEVAILVLGKLFGKTPTDLFIDKKTPITEVPPENEDIRRGNLLESVAGALYKRETEGAYDVTAHFPDNQEAHETDKRWFLRHPVHLHRTANVDGLQDDGWILEIKCPRQRIADQIEQSGIKDYYYIQAMYQAGIAYASGTFCFEPGECRGTRVIVFHPERAKFSLFEVPIDHDFISEINMLVDRFWHEHVAKNDPPLRWDNTRQPTMDKRRKYLPLQGDDFAELEGMFLVASERYERAKRKRDQIKESIAELLTETNIPLAELPGGTKIICREQAGRKAFDFKLAKYENPDVPWGRYEKQGKPFRVFKATATKVERANEDSLYEDNAIEIGEELQAFTRTEMDIEEATEVHDSLRAKAELQLRSLELEMQALDGAMKQAEQSMRKRISK